MKEYKNTGYFITKNGEVYQIKRGTYKLLKTSKDRYGYEHVGLQINKKRVACTVHRLVAIVYLNNNKDIKLPLCVDHIDSDRMNNNLWNLQIITVRQNLTRQLVFKASASRNVKKAVSINKGKPMSAHVKQILIDSLQKKVINISTGISYNSVKEASLLSSDSKATISRHLKRDNTDIFKRWKYL